MTTQHSTNSPALSAKIAQELRSIARVLKRKMREQGHAGDLTPSQTSVLLRLEKEGPMSTSALARAEGMRPQSMSALVASLEAMGFIAGEADPTDGRRTMLHLTDSCRELIQTGRAARQDWLSKTIDAKLSPDEQQQLLAAMALLQRLVE